VSVLFRSHGIRQYCYSSYSSGHLLERGPRRMLFDLRPRAFVGYNQRVALQSRRVQMDPLFRVFRIRPERRDPEVGAAYRKLLGCRGRGPALSHL